MVTGCGELAVAMAILLVCFAGLVAVVYATALQPQVCSFYPCPGESDHLATMWRRAVSTSRRSRGPLRPGSNAIGDRAALLRGKSSGTDDAV